MNNPKNFLGITIDKHISIGHIFTTFAAIVAGVSAYMGMINRIQNLEFADIRMQKQIEEQKTEHKYTLDKIYVSLEKINDKLDTKVDR
jgi:hypothetical protein